MHGEKRKGRLWFADGARFLASLMSTPHLTGAVAPSSRALARAMAAAAGPMEKGLVVELGPGTGPVTRALIDRGLDPRRLAMVEYNPEFCRVLKERFPDAEVVEGDAYDLKRVLNRLAGTSVAAFVSSLPLLTRPPGDRGKLLGDAFALMGRDGVFVQFTYGPLSPIPHDICEGRYSARRGRAVWANIPPARVWTYRLETPEPAARAQNRSEARA